MPKSAEHDFALNAFRIVEKAIGEHMDGRPLEQPQKPSPNAHRGHARAASLTPKQRTSIARKAAESRWAKNKKTS